MSNRWRKAYRVSGIDTYEARCILNGPRPKPGKGPPKQNWRFIDKCKTCGIDMMEHRWGNWCGKYVRKKCLALQVAKTRPKSHPRRDKRGQSKPR